jgi:hypothetical protein
MRLLQLFDIQSENAFQVMSIGEFFPGQLQQIGSELKLMCPLSSLKNLIHKPSLIRIRTNDPLLASYSLISSHQVTENKSSASYSLINTHQVTEIRGVYDRTQIQ